MCTFPPAKQVKCVPAAICRGGGSGCVSMCTSAPVKQVKYAPRPLRDAEVQVHSREREPVVVKEAGEGRVDEGVED